MSIIDTSKVPQTDEEIQIHFNKLIEKTGKIGADSIYIMRNYYYFYRTQYGVQEAIMLAYIGMGSPINRPDDLNLNPQTDDEAKDAICEIGLGKGTAPNDSNRTWTISALSLYSMFRDRSMSVTEAFGIIMEETNKRW